MLISTMLCGCVTETTSDRPRYEPVVRQNVPTGFGEPPPQARVTGVPVEPDQPARRPSGARTGPATAPAPIVPVTCQGALDEICSALLIHYRVYDYMPEKLDDLKRFQEFANLGDFRCPVSGQPYIYYPQGVRVADEELKREGREPVRIATYVLLVDPAASHGGLRYAIFIQRPEGAEAIQARIGILPNDALPPGRN